MNSLCKGPFFTAEIFDNGDVYCCCPDYIKIGKIGNIFEQSWDEVWNSDIAQNFRNKILAGDYSLCKSSFCEPNFLPLCHELNSPCLKELDFNNPKPKIVKFSTDPSCNVACTICRGGVFCNGNPERTKWLDAQIEPVFLPILKDVEIVNFTGSGDPFASKHFRNFIKIIAKTYPNIKFDLHTNGTLCDENNLKELGILDRLSTIQISLHSASKEVYDKIVLKGNWERLNKNLEFLAGLIEKNKLYELQLNFVITSVNYKDIPAFIELCKKYHAKAFLWQYRDLFGGGDYDELNICSPIHRNHNEFIKIMTSPEVAQAQNVFMSPLLRKFSQINNVEQYNSFSTILIDIITERYESKFSATNRRFENIECRLNHLEGRLNNNPLCTKRNLWQKIFSVTNEYNNMTKYKIVRLLGFKIKFKRKNQK